MNTKRPILHELPLLGLLEESERQRIIDAGDLRQLNKGEILFHEGDTASAMYALASGKLKLVKYSPKGKEMLLHLVAPAETFAEASLFGDGLYPATCEALQPSEVWRLPRAALVSMIGAAPELGLALVASTARWTKRLATKLEILTQRRVEERVALYVLARVGERRLEAGDHVVLNEPKNLIASLCGTAPEVLSRTFRRLEDDGILRSDGDRLEILKPADLYALADFIG